MIYNQTFVVRGRGTFPFDMLRYDYCWPASEGMSSLLDCNPITHGDDYFKCAREVKLKRQVSLKTNLPTAARWRSFGWEVIEESIETTKY